MKSKKKKPVRRPSSTFFFSNREPMYLHPYGLKELERLHEHLGKYLEYWKPKSREK